MKPAALYAVPSLLTILLRAPCNSRKRLKLQFLSSKVKTRVRPSMFANSGQLIALKVEQGEPIDSQMLSTQRSHRVSSYLIPAAEAHRKKLMIKLTYGVRYGVNMTFV